MTYTTWDIETTTVTKFKRKASPFTPENWPVTHGFKRAGDTQVTEQRFGHSRPPAGWLLPVLEGTKLLIGMNIKFDLLHALQDQVNLNAWMEWVACGGNVWDIQLAEYLLNGMGQRDHMLSLDEIAPRYGGNVKVDEVKILWQAGVKTEDIDPVLLSRYLCGGEDENGEYQLGDVENTEKIALAQIARARECKQLNSILLNMGALICTVEMERNGMYVDRGLGLEIAGKLKQEKDDLEASLGKFLPENLPFDFSWGSRVHKSALIFGGQVYYDTHEYDLKDGTKMLRADWEGADPRPPRVYAQKDEVFCFRPDGSLVPLAEAPSDAVRYASGKNEGEIKTKKIKVDNLDKPKGRTVKVPYTFPGVTSPKAEWASLDSMGEPTGVYSVAGAVITELGNRDIPFLKALARLQSVTKDLGTYFITTDEVTGESKGMLTLVADNGIIHHSLNMVSTVTGRLSSSNPNLQNLSKGEKSDVKSVFTSRFPQGKIIQSDFSSLEIYIQAILTHCRQLVDDLKAGTDLHCKRLAAKEGMDYDEVVKLAKGYKLPDGSRVAAVPEWAYKRTRAKEFSFQRAYGAGAQKISESTGIPLDEIKALIAYEDRVYPEISAYFDKRTIEIKKNRKSGGHAVPHPVVRGVMCSLGSSSVRTPDNKLYSYQESPSPEYLVSKGIFSSFSPTEIKNYEVQGSGGEFAKAAMWLAVRYFYSKKNWGGAALLVNQVHDAVYGDADALVSHEAAAAIHACMAAASDFMEYYFKWPLELPVPSETTWGASMMESDPVPEVEIQAVPIRQELRRMYMRGYKPSYTT